MDPRRALAALAALTLACGGKKSDGSGVPAGKASAAPPAAAALAAISDAQPMALPSPMAAFDSFLSELEKAPPTAARAKQTCAIATDDKARGMFFEVWQVAPPSSVPRDEWKGATEDFANMEYEIGDMCHDLDWDDDVTVLAKLRRRFDRLVRLVSR